MENKTKMEQAARGILERAVNEDRAERYTNALLLYQEGLTILLESIKDAKNSTKAEHLRVRAKEYIGRAEKIKAIIAEKKAAGKYREQTKIEDGATGYGYASLFGRFFDESSVTHIQIEDPYIRSFHQCQNLVRLCELAVQKCSSLSRISLLTTLEPRDRQSQLTNLQELRNSLSSRNITLEISFSNTLHDRQISLSNGWVIKIGRGLDYFKAPDGKFVLGTFDLDLRRCHETTVDIFHTSDLNNSL